MDLYKVGLTISTEDYEWLDFSLEKTQSALYDAGKKFEKLFTTYLVLFVLAAILTYGRGIGTEGLGSTSLVKVPLLELSLDRRYAALALIVLSTAVLSSLVCLVVYEEVLRFRTEGLVLIRYGKISEIGDVPDDHYWYLRYPSLFRMSLFLSSSYYGAGTVISNMFLMIALSGLIMPEVFAWHVGKEFLWSTSARVGLVVGVSVLPFLSCVLLVAIFPRSQAAAAIYLKLQEYFRERKN